jgi:signal transduction histidine kinase
VSTALALLGWTAAGLAVLARLAAARASSVRMEAVRHACHELRGPLTAVRLGLELEGRHGTLPPARLRAIDLELGRAALALEDLDGAESPDGRLSLRSREPVDMAALIRDSVEAWRPAAQRRGVDLRMVWSGPTGSVSADRLRLAQATGNLIANALEHGAGPVEVRGGLAGEIVRVEVLDSGPGLSAPLAELGRRRRRQTPRRGRGLQIVSRIAAAHGGRLTAAHRASGARLVLELPAAAATWRA